MNHLCPFNIYLTIYSRFLLCFLQKPLIIFMCLYRWVSWQWQSTFQCKHFTPTTPKAKPFSKSCLELWHRSLSALRWNANILALQPFKTHILHKTFMLFFTALEAVLFPSGHANLVWVFRTFQISQTLKTSLHCRHCVFLKKIMI